MKAVDTSLGKYSIIARMFELINHISEDQFVIILKDLLGDNFSAQLFKLVIDLPEEQQVALLNHLQKKVHARHSRERRSQSRKPCLIPLTYLVRGRQFDGYILDINDHGVFIETGNAFFSGQEIIMTFSAPRNQKALTITGQIVWSSQDGIGVTFNRLTAHQHKAIQAFSEDKAEVYKIRS
ncbi:MAG: PilZ domain-containing protein [Deltaproteobacteria bacterium]|jgi:Tfp pilus assembly protein PilZ|nr:PilZ domain-containing protein [Deltaproteobacteria bacterium]